MKVRTMNLQELKRNNKKYFANGTKSFFQNKVNGMEKRIS